MRRSRENLSQVLSALGSYRVQVHLSLNSSSLSSRVLSDQVLRGISMGNRSQDSVMGTDGWLPETIAPCNSSHTPSRSPSKYPKRRQCKERWRKLETGKKLSFSKRWFQRLHQTELT
jgi:hypothetical protein